MDIKKLGVGLYSLAGVYGKKDLNELRLMLLEAFESGIDYFDVAQSYGSAEEFIAEVLKDYKDRIKIATKGGLTEMGRDCSYENIITSCENSLKLLKRDFIDYFQIHFDDPKTPVDETIAALEDLKKRGWIIEYGVGHLPLNRVEEYVKKGQISGVMIEFSPVVLKSYFDLYPLCDRYKLNMIAMGVTGRGLLTGKIKPGQTFEQGDIRNIDPLFQHGLFKSAMKVLDRFQVIAKKYNKTSVQVAINWVMNKPGINRVLIGPSTREHLRENLGSCGWKLDEKDLRDLNEFLIKEAENRKEIVKKDIEDILFNRSVDDKEQIFIDLIYVISGMIDFYKNEEKDILPYFDELMLWRKRKGDLKEIKDIKMRIRKNFFI